MDLDLTADQELFRDTTRQFLNARVPLTTVRKWADLDLGYEPGWWREGAELGWTTLLVPEDRGGGSISGEGLCDLVLVAEEMGALVTPGPLSPVNVVAQTVAVDGSSEQAERILPGLMSGETTAAWCGPYPPSQPGVTARPDGDGFVLDGMARPVEAAAGADWLLVTATGPGGVTQFVLPTPTTGVTVTPLRGLDLVRRHAKVVFDNVRVGRETVVGEVDGAQGAVERQLRTALVLQCAEAAGATGCVFDFTVQYSFDRFSFGRPLASYQALKHRFADMKVTVESAYAIAGEAAHAVQEGRPDAGEVVRVAKAYIGERCPEVIQDCVQMHGGIGVTWDHDLHLYLRRVVLHRQTYGDPMEYREQLAVMAGL